MKQPCLALRRTTFKQILSKVDANKSGPLVRLSESAADFLRKELNDNRHLMYIAPREHIETDMDYVHFLPYCVVVSENADKSVRKILCYNRPGKNTGERRLDGKFSIGFGGHVDGNDCYMPGKPGMDYIESIFSRNLCRELCEELSLKIDEFRGAGWGNVSLAYPEYKGVETYVYSMAVPKSMRCSAVVFDSLILDESDEVGKFHIGVVYVFRVLDLALEDISCNPDEIRNLRLLTLEQACQEPEPENWTRFLLEAAT